MRLARRRSPRRSTGQSAAVEPSNPCPTLADRHYNALAIRGIRVRFIALAQVASRPVIIWLNGTHGAGKTTTSALVQRLIPDSRVFDAEKVGETLMDIKPGLPSTDNFQHWPPWRPLVVETARCVLNYTGGTLVMPMTVLVEDYWREISAGLAQHAIPVRHFVLHAEPDTLRERIMGDTVLGPSSFRLRYLDPYAKAADAWLHNAAEVVDTTHLTADQAALRIADAVQG